MNRISRVFWLQRKSSNVLSSVISIFLLTLVGSVVHAEPTALELVLSEKRCEDVATQSLRCEYKIGKTLHISINGIGQPDTGVTFMKSDFDGDFYATFGVLHGCIIVKRGSRGGSSNALDWAFISPRNGKAYGKWQDCQSGM